jgi:hypothetical protein
MIDFRADRRTDDIYGVLVDPWRLDDEYQRVEIGDDGQLSFNYYTDEKVSGHIEPLDFPDVNNRMLRIYCDMTKGSETERVKVGTFFMRRRDIGYAVGAKTRRIELHSMNYRFIPDATNNNIFTRAGAVALDWLKERIGIYSSAAIYAAPGVDKAKTFVGSVAAGKAGRPYLEVLNYVADYLGCGSVDVDSHGRQVFAPYVVPANRPVIWTFIDNENCQYEDEIIISSSEDDVPTGIKVYNPADNTYYYRELPDWSPYSRQMRGRYVHAYYTHPDLGNAAAYNKKADEYYAAMLSTAVSIEISHYFAPIKHGDAVRFIRQETNTDVVGVVHAIDMSLVPGLPCRTVLDIVNGALGNVYP